jgi:hypothetical protein
MVKQQQTTIGDPALVRMREQLAELTKRRDRLDRRIRYLGMRITDHPNQVRRYEEGLRRGGWLAPFLVDPRK